MPEYARDLNGTEAAIGAGYSPRSAEVTASRLLTNANIQAAIVARQDRIMDELDITTQDIVREGWSIATDPAQPASARVAALGLLAKRHPEFSEKRHVKQLAYTTFTLNLGRDEGE